MFAQGRKRLLHRPNLRIDWRDRCLMIDEFDTLHIVGDQESEENLHVLGWADMVVPVWSMNVCQKRWMSSRVTFYLASA
jgi:hypothetical protein